MLKLNNDNNNSAYRDDIFLISKTSPFRGGNAIAETTENQKLG